MSYTRYYFKLILFTLFLFRMCFGQASCLPLSGTDANHPNGLFLQLGPQKQYRGPRQNSSPTYITQIGGGALVLAIIAMVTSYDGWRLHQQLMAASEREVANLALALATDRRAACRRSMCSFGTRQHGTRPRADEESTEVIHDALASRAVGVSQLSMITIVDRSGMQRIDRAPPASRSATSRIAAISCASATIPMPDLVINESAFSRSEQVPSLVLSRSLRRPNSSSTASSPRT